MPARAAACWIATLGMLAAFALIGCADLVRELARTVRAGERPAALAPPDSYGYFAVAPHQRRACGQRLVLTLHDEPGRELPDGLLVRVGDEHCWLSLVTHKRIVGMGAVDRWTYASADVPTEPVLGQAGIGPSVGREVQP